MEMARVDDKSVDQVVGKANAPEPALIQPQADPEISGSYMVLPESVFYKEDRYNREGQCPVVRRGEGSEPCWAGAVSRHEG